MAKEALKSKQIEMGSQILQQGQLLSVISVFCNLQMQQISVKHCLINFMSYKTDYWTDEYLRGLPVHQQRHRPSSFKKQNNQC